MSLTFACPALFADQKKFKDYIDMCLTVSIYNACRLSNFDFEITDAHKMKINKGTFNDMPEEFSHHFELFPGLEYSDILFEIMSSKDDFEIAHLGTECTSVYQLTGKVSSSVERVTEILHPRFMYWINYGIPFDLSITKDEVNNGKFILEITSTKIVDTEPNWYAPIMNYNPE